MPQWIEELGRFADLDYPVTASEKGDIALVFFRQRGASVKVTFSAAGEVREDRDSEPTIVHSSYLGLLASSNYGDLRSLARMQLAIIRNTEGVTSSYEDIPIGGELVASDFSKNGKSVLEQLDDWTAGVGADNRLSAIVIDGPAGIGKTHLISSLVKVRAAAFGPASRPLVVHVQSRGRQLTTLPDLLARTLQSMRVQVTYEQIPVLAKHGLVQLAIDGFDELADPNGYETAWRSVRDFLSEIEGGGVVILAGRDTFIDAEAVRRALPILSDSSIAALHLRPPSEQQAISWLRRSGLEEARIDALEATDLLSEANYTLRPFFLRQVRAIAESNTGISLLTSFPLGTLIQAMIIREMRRMAPLGLGVPEELLYELLNQLFQETAREMADSESDSIDVPSLQLISEIVFSPHIQDETLRALRNRIQTVALLDPDLTPDRRRFVHSEVHAFFLASAYVRVLGAAEVEIPRSVRRNIVGSELLEVFHDVARTTQAEQIERFRKNSVTALLGRRHDDRSPGNIAALLLATLGSIDSESDLVIEDVSVDESLIRGVASTVILKRVTISKLDVRGADLSEVIFEGCQVASLVLDTSSRLPASIPMPAMLQVDHEGGQRNIYDPDEIREWLKRIGDPELKVGQVIPMGGPTGKLLDKLCRTILRQSWIRDDEDDRAGRLLRDESWPRLREILLKHELLDERSDMPAGGRKSQFVRIRRARELINPELRDTQIEAFFRDL